MQRDKNPWSSNGQRVATLVRHEVTSDLFGWKAMPFALDDFDSNYSRWLGFARIKANGASCLGQHIR